MHLSVAALNIHASTTIKTAPDDQTSPPNTSTVSPSLVLLLLLFPPPPLLFSPFSLLLLLLNDFPPPPPVLSDGGGGRRSMLRSSRARVYKNGIVVCNGKSSASFVSFFPFSSGFQVGFKQSWVKKKKNRNFSKLLRASLLSSKPGSFDSAEREREREARRTRLRVVLVFLRLFL